MSGGGRFGAESAPWPAVAKVLESWRPTRLDPEDAAVVHLVLPVVRVWVAAAAPGDPHSARTLLWMTTRLAVWAYRTIGSLDAALVLHPHNIQHYVMYVNSHRSRGWRHKARSVLRRVSRAANPKGWEPRLPEAGKPAVPERYGQNDEAAFVLEACMPGRAHRAGRMSVVGLSLGAGLLGCEVRAGRVEDLFSLRDGRIGVCVGGPNPRLVPVRDNYTGIVRRAADASNSGRFVAARSNNAVYSIAERLAPNGSGLSLRRARNTWLAAHLVAGTPLPALRAIAGRISAQTLNAVLEHVCAAMSPQDAGRAGAGRMTRKQWRRAKKAAERMGMDLEQYQAWTNTELPEDHSNPGGEPLRSSLQAGWAAIRTVERSKTLSHIEPKMKGRRGPKVRFAWKALLVCMQLAGTVSSKSYRRSDVTAVLYGLHPVVAQELGVIDEKGNWKTISHKVVNKMHKKLERRLRLGWNSGSVRCNMGWFTQSMIKASAPRKIRRSVTAVAVDSTSVPAWARTLCYGKQADLNKDAYALHRKAILKDPNRSEPELKRRKLAAAAKKMGLEVGEDGRIIRGKDRDMRVGWATGTAKTKGHYFVGYELTIVVAVRSISWRGNPCRAKLGSAIPPYILAMSFNPAGTNPGPIGFEAVSKARQIAPNINEVIADRAYTVKREDFVRPLHRLGINVVMDYPKITVQQAQRNDPGQTLPERDDALRNDPASRDPQKREDTASTPPPQRQRTGP